jgi:hypothetical protein
MREKLRVEMELKAKDDARIAEQKRIETCNSSRQSLDALPSFLDLVQKIMPGKASVCAVSNISEDGADEKILSCVRAACVLEDWAGEENTCDKLDREWALTQAREKQLLETIVSNRCDESSAQNVIPRAG